MKVYLKVPIVLVISILSLYAQQSVYQQWATRYNGTGNGYDGGVCVKTDNLGNVYITGTSLCSGSGRNYLTIKYSSTGGVDWVRTFNGAANGGDYSNALALDNSGNVYVTGRCDNGSPTLSDYATIKYNASGDQIWVAYYNGPGNSMDEAAAIVVDNSGNVYVTGRSLGVNSGYDIATVKYDVNGNLLWAERYNGPGNGDDLANSMVLDGSNNVYVCGESLGANTGNDGVLIKYNTDGEQQWANRYTAPAYGRDAFVSVKTLSAFVYVTGFTYAGTTDYDYITIKYDLSGVQQWAKKYDGGFNRGDFATALALDQTGDVYVTGSCNPNTGIADSSYATIKYNPDGNVLWIRSYPGPLNSTNVPRDIAVDNTGNIYITGSSLFSGCNHYTTIKYTGLGDIQWVMTYSGLIIGNNYAKSIALDNNNNVYITGVSWGIDYDIATIKYGPDLLGVQHNGNNIPHEYSLSQNYPNPFNPSTNINFSIPVSGNVKLAVYDIQGNKVEELLNKFLNANNYSVSWDASKYSSGVYFYKLQANSYSATKKMILVK